MNQLSGIEYPAHLEPVYKEDWEKEQAAKSEEIIQRDLDLLGSGVMSGGDVSVGASPNTVDVGATVACDSEGRRISVPGLAGVAVPANASCKIVVRHKFVLTDNVSPSNTSASSPIVWRDNSYEVIARQGALAAGDVALRDVTAAAGVVTLGSDLRSWRVVRGENVEDESLTLEKQAATVKTGLLADLHADIDAGISAPKTFAKAITWVYSLLKTFTEVTFAAEKKLLGEIFWLDDFRETSAAFPAVCVSKGDHNIAAANFGQDAIDHLRSIPLRYDPSGANYVDFEPSDWDITSNVGTITFKNATPEIKLIAALLKDNVVHGSFTNWLTCTFLDTVGSIAANPTDAIAITGVNASNRQISFAYPAANGSGSTTGKRIRFYVHRVPGSTTQARLFQQAGRGFFTVGDSDSEWIGGLRRVDQMQGFKPIVGASGFSYGGVGSGAQSITNAGAGGIQIDGAIVDDGTNGTPRVGKRTHGPGTGAFAYRWLGTYAP